MLEIRSCEGGKAWGPRPLFAHLLRAELLLLQGCLQCSAVPGHKQGKGWVLPGKQRLLSLSIAWGERRAGGRREKTRTGRF